MILEYSKNKILNTEITPEVILSLFQEAASEHAEILGCGFDSLIKRNLLWVVMRTRYEVVKFPEIGEEIALKTWPLAPSRLGFRRDYLILNVNGEALIKGSSDWMLINSETRTLEKAEGIYPEGEFSAAEAIEGRSKRLHPPKNAIGEYKVSPTAEDIDQNGHVNNTKYAKYVLSALNSNIPEIKKFAIDYHKEVMPDSELTVSVENIGEAYAAIGKNKDGDTMFICEFRC